MKKLLLGLVFLACACSNENENIKKRIIPILTKKTLQDSVVVKLDSLIIDSVVSFTELEWAKEKIRRFNNLIKLNESFSESSRKYIQSSIELADIEKRGNKIENETMAILLHDESYNNKKPEATLATKMTIEEEKGRLNEYQDDIKRYRKSIASLEKQIFAKNLNSTDIRGYIPYYRVIGSDSKGYEVSDTLRIYFSKDMNLIPLE